MLFIKSRKTNDGEQEEYTMIHTTTDFKLLLIQSLFNWPTFSAVTGTKGWVPQMRTSETCHSRTSSFCSKLVGEIILIG